MVEYQFQVGAWLGGQSAGPEDSRGLAHELVAADAGAGLGEIPHRADQLLRTHLVQDATVVFEGHPEGVVVAARGGAQRRWTNLWKPTLDGLDSLLGKTFEAKDWNPQDGRIVRLGFHHRVVDSPGHDAEAQIWSTVADSSWPGTAMAD